MIPTDTELVGLAQAGDIEALCELVERHRPVALRVSYAIVGAEAEDVVQEAFVKAYKNLDRFRTDAPFRPWLLTIVANEARNRRRSSTRRGALHLRVANRDAAHGSSTTGPDPPRRSRWRTNNDTGCSTQSPVCPTATARSSRCATSPTSRRRRRPTALACPVGTVKSRLARAIGRLRASLGAEVVLVIDLELQLRDLGAISTIRRRSDRLTDPPRGRLASS